MIKVFTLRTYLKNNKATLVENLTSYYKILNTEADIVFSRALGVPYKIISKDTRMSVSNAKRIIRKFRKVNKLSESTINPMLDYLILEIRSS